MYVRTLGMSGYRGLGASAGSAAVGGAISAGVSLATSAASMWLSSINLSHDADTATTQIVNGLAPLLQANKDAYMQGPGTCADQAAAMAAYLTAVQWLFSVKGCGNGAYGSAGNRCMSDRFGPGGATDTNAKYPWAAYYYWPIANDPRASGCAALVTGTDAGEESAIANIAAVTGGITQTTPGEYVASGTASGSGLLVNTGGSSILTDTLLGLPVWLWAAGLGAILLLK